VFSCGFLLTVRYYICSLSVGTFDGPPESLLMLSSLQHLTSLRLGINSRVPDAASRVLYLLRAAANFRSLLALRIGSSTSIPVDFELLGQALHGLSSNLRTILLPIALTSPLLHAMRFHFTALEDISMPIRSATALAYPTTLRSLELRFDTASAVNWLQNAAPPAALDIPASLAYLASCTRLSHLTLSLSADVQFDASLIGALARLQRLEFLHISSSDYFRSDAPDFSPLRKCTSLQALRLESPASLSMSTLSALSSVVALHLNCYLAEPFLSLTSLVRLQKLSITLRSGAEGFQQELSVTLPLSFERLSLDLGIQSTSAVVSLPNISRLTRLTWLSVGTSALTPCQLLSDLPISLRSLWLLRPFPYTTASALVASLSHLQSLRLLQLPERTPLDAPALHDLCTRLRRLTALQVSFSPSAGPLMSPAQLLALLSRLRVLTVVTSDAMAERVWRGNHGIMFNRRDPIAFIDD
jgi:hypothetical protein